VSANDLQTLLKQLVQRYGTQSALAKAIGVTDSRLANVLKGETGALSVRNCLRLARGARLSPSQILRAAGDAIAHHAGATRELEFDNFVPVVVATDDRRNGVLASSFVANGARIRVCFPMWEMNGVLRDNLAAMQRLIVETRNAAPQADCYLHFTPGHASISPDEAGGWRWSQDQGVVGLLAQGSNEFAAEDPVTGGRGLESTAIRLAGRTDLGAPASWAGLHQLTVKFEYGVLEIFNGGVNEEAQRTYTAQFLADAPHVVGFCDGGPAAALATT
jgi:transcriptional regulator with XRE-family HTH domain